jgi:SAM-dependent methyltransferase
MMKSFSLTALGHLRLLSPAYRAYEDIRTLNVRNGTVRPPDGLPLPPARLRVRVAGTASAGWFLEGGRLAAETIRDVLERNGTRLDDLRTKLDFGCGCGRVLRHMANLRGEIYGADVDAHAIAWCRENLPFAHFERNDLALPLSHDNGSLDLVFALSVFTHLPVDLQHRWMQELTRVLRPGGLLLLTTHGDPYLKRLTASERAVFSSGEVVVRCDQLAGTNLCTAFHPRTYVQQSLGRELELIDFVAEGAKGNPYQDLFLLRKP